jgi:5,10-methylenetetrahydromethanopterin reductase
LRSRPVYSCALPPSRDVVGYARIAAANGYERVWVYDSPALYGDLWIALARIAEAVPDIGLASGVAVPVLRHPMVTASAIATIEELAPGRLWACFGTGFTARLTLGQRAMRWDQLAVYVKQLKALLKGDVVEIDGKSCQMLNSPGWGPPRPIKVPIGLAPMGPKGFAISRELADGVILTAIPQQADRGWSRAALLVNGTVLESGEDHSSPRVIDAAGPAYVTGFHAIWEWSPAFVDEAPGGAQWRRRIDAERPEGQRHLAVHEGHFVAVTDRDRPLVDAAGGRLVQTGWTGDPPAVARRFDEAGAAGITEVVFSPMGPDIERELTAFAEAARR